ncbi:MAG: hypothetical protein GXZ15_01345 [Campylobacter sp.]|nr:hypothetical protein [Campylobacter sp.]
MKVKDIYSMIALIFSANFQNVIEKEKFENLPPKWLLTNESKENKKAHELWDMAKSESYEDIEKDFKELKPYFQMSYYKLINEIEVQIFYDRSRYKKPFSTLNASHASNMLALLAAIFKVHDEKTHQFLGEYLTIYFMESFRALAEILKTQSKTSYYQSFGWFMDDYLKMLKITLKLKI